MNRYDENRLKENPEIEPYFNDISQEEAERAYNGTSMSPDRAGSLDRASYALSLIEDREEAGKSLERAILKGATSSPADIDQWFDAHRAGLQQAYRAYLYSHASCISSFITGPANFPVRRAQKLNGYADNKLKAIGEFRKKSIKRFLREALPYGNGNAIKTDDPECQEKLSKKIVILEQDADRMVIGNKIYALAKKGKLSPEKIAQKFDLSENSPFLQKMISFVPAYDYIKKPYTWELSNLRANIRRLKERAAEVKQVEAMQIHDTFPKGETASISDDQKIVIDFGYKPEEEVRAILKRNAFKWSRLKSAWVRKLTANALNAYRSTVKPLIEGGAAS